MREHSGVYGFGSVNRVGPGKDEGRAYVGRVWDWNGLVVVLLLYSYLYEEQFELRQPLGCNGCNDLVRWPQHRGEVALKCRIRHRAPNQAHRR